MHLIVGLGNPGAEYYDTRHSVGFAVADLLAERSGSGFHKKFKGELGRARVAGTSCLLLKPLTYMNRSGVSVALAGAYFRVPPEDMIVVHDEVDLPFGRLRVKVGGGHAGHNGLRSLVDALGSRDFARIRMGVGRPQRGTMSDHVLSGWRAEEREWVDDLITRGADAVTEILRNGPTAAMNRFNGE